MLGSPFTASKGVIDVITNVRRPREKKNKGKTGRIDVRHFGGFWEVLDSNWEAEGTENIEPSTSTVTAANTFYICPCTDCLVVQKQTQSYGPEWFFQRKNAH